MTNATWSTKGDCKKRRTRLSYIHIFHNMGKRSALEGLSSASIPFARTGRAAMFGPGMLAAGPFDGILLSGLYRLA
jgi:hypothetical protein